MGRSRMPNHSGTAIQEMPMLVWHLIFHHKNIAVAILRDHLRVVYLLCGYFLSHGKNSMELINLKHEKRTWHTMWLRTFFCSSKWNYTLYNTVCHFKLEEMIIKSNKSPTAARAC